MTPARVLTLGLLLPLLPVQPARAQEKPEVEAYRYGAMARSSELQGKNAEALDYFNRSLALKPDPVIYSNRGDLKKRLGDRKGAVADYDEAIALALKPADSALLYGNRGLLKHQLGDLEGAVADYDQVLLLKPDNAIILNNRGYARITKGDFAGAIADYSKAVALQPKTISLRENLANARRDQGDLAGAIAEHDKIVALDPNNTLRYFFRGELKQLKGDFGGAIKDYDKLLELKPDAWGGYLQRGAARQSLGDLEAALADYDKAVSGNPEHDDYGWAYREIVLRRLKRGTPDAELSKIAAKGKAGFPNDIVLFLSGTLAESDFLAKAGQGDAAAASERQCAAFYFAGMSRLLAGDRAAAGKFLEQSVATKRTFDIEFGLARAELARLAKPAP